MQRLCPATEMTGTTAVCDFFGGQRSHARSLMFPCLTGMWGKQQLASQSQHKPQRNTVGPIASVNKM